MNTSRNDGSNCFVCGPENAQGLQLKFVMEHDVCRSRFVPPAHMVGYDDLVHGGLLFTVLDDTMANWLFLKGVRAHTARCEIRYRQPVHLGTELALEARVSRIKGRTVLLEATASRATDGVVVAETTATFMVADGADLLALQAL
jgi:acyl-coenzyme A thioesterase PaaI-like protein